MSLANIVTDSSNEDTNVEHAVLKALENVKTILEAEKEADMDHEQLQAELKVMLKVIYLYKAAQNNKYIPTPNPRRARS